MNKIHRGTLIQFSGTWGSGLGFLTIQDDDLGRVSVPCDNGCTVRALEGAFGNTIGGGHSVKRNAGYKGKRVYWSYDEFGLTLGGFTPVKAAGKEIKKLYKEGKDE